MFPVTITLNTADQLNAVMAALGNPHAATVAAAIKPAKTEAVAEKKSVEKSPSPAQEQKAVAATESAATVTTAATTAAPEPKAEVSEVKLLDADELANAVRAAIAKAGRDPVVALLSSYGVKKAGEVEAGKRPEFDAKLIALAA